MGVSVHGREGPSLAWGKRRERGFVGWGGGGGGGGGGVFFIGGRRRGPLPTSKKELKSRGEHHFPE